MDYYTNAQGYENAANKLVEIGCYQQSIHLSCIAVELYLKSKLPLVPHDKYLETSHDVLKMYRTLTSKFKPKSDMREMITMCRKYFNESRYPSSTNTDVFTKDFAVEFTEFIEAIRDFIDNECIATLNDLQEKYRTIKK